MPIEPDEIEGDDDVEDILHCQDEAMQLLGRRRAEEPLGGDRDFRRWPTPQGVTLDFHDSLRCHRADVDNSGGGARLHTLPAWLKRPAAARLKAPSMGCGALVLADVMWRDKQGGAGVRFEFLDNEDRDLWAGGLIDALLARYALG